MSRWIAPDQAEAGPQAQGSALDGLQQLDTRMLGRLGHAIDLSEHASLQMVQRIGGLRSQSARLLDYLDTARAQSQQMQAEIERSGAIVADLASFVQQLPAQIAQEREQLDRLVGEVQRLPAVTESIRGLARQTEILAINAAIEAARAGEAGRGFGVLAGEVRHLAMQSSEAAASIESTIHQLVETVHRHSRGEFASRMQHNEDEAARLLTLTGQLDDGYLDMRQFYAMLLTAITEHNNAIDADIGQLLDAVQYQDIFKQIVDRLQPAFESRHAFVAELIARLRHAGLDSAELDRRAAALADAYERAEAAHGLTQTSATPAATTATTATTAASVASGAPRIELF